MANRPNLQTILEEILGSRNVYYQPPESVKMNYPAIVYEFEGLVNTYADGGVYLTKHKYSLILIDKNPDSLFVGKINRLSFCSFVRHYKSDNLNHYVFTLYF